MVSPVWSNKAAIFFHKNWMKDCLLMLFAITLLLGWSTFCPQTILTLLTFFVIIVADLIFVIICRWSCGALSAHVSTHDVNLASAQLPQMFEAAFEHFELYHSPSSSSLPLIDVKISSLQLWKDVKFPITSFLSTIFPAHLVLLLVERWLLPGRRLPNHWRQVTAQRQGESTRWGGGRVTNVKNAEFATVAVCFESEK